MIRSRPSERAANRKGTVATCSAIAQTARETKATCPKGLAEHLANVAEALELHMQKEEQILFPLFQSSRAHMAAMPVQMMEEEHHDHARNLARIRELTNGLKLPPEACGTWTALYLGLADLEQQVMEHIHLENNVLFPRALRR